MKHVYSFAGVVQSLKNNDLGFSHDTGSGSQSQRVIFSWLSPYCHFKEPRLLKIKGQTLL